MKNDFFWFFQSYSFLKDQILTNHFLPLWQNQILSGSPYLGDPQNPLLYLPNYLVLILPVKVFFLVFFVGHFLLAAFGMYYFSRKLNFPVLAAFFSAVVYAFSPVFAAHLEEGHVNMVAAFAWFPLFMVGIYGLMSKPKFFYAVLLGISAAAIFNNYLTIFFYSVVAGMILWVFKFRFQNWKETLKLLIIAGLIFGAITLPQVLVSYQYFPLTTRSLISTVDLYPQFPSVRNFIVAIIDPYFAGLSGLGAETVLTTGILPMLMAALGFMLLTKKYKILTLIFGLVAIYLALSLKMPGYGWLVKTLPALLWLRTTTRFWFIVILVVGLLGGYFLKQKLSRRYQLILCFLAILELSFFNWSFFTSKPIKNESDQSFRKLVEPVLKQPGYFRIYCLTGCPREIELSGKGMASGYNPIMLSNYYDYVTVAGGYHFNLYTLSLPVYQSFPDKPQPHSQALGMLGVQYVVSPYPLVDPGFAFIGAENSNLLYQNVNSRPRAYTVIDGQILALPVVSDKPGEMVITLNPNATRVYVSEVFMPLWQAVDQTGKELKVRSFDKIILSIETNKASQITVSFLPSRMRTLVVVSLLTSLFGFGYLVCSRMVS